MSRANFMRKSSLYSGVHKVVKSIGKRIIVKGLSDETTLFHFFNITEKHHSFTVEANPLTRNQPYVKQYIEVPIKDEKGNEILGKFESKLANPINITGYDSGSSARDRGVQHEHREDIVQLIPIKSTDEKSINRAGANIRPITILDKKFPDSPRKPQLVVKTNLYKAIYHNKEVIRKAEMESKRHRV